MLNSLRADSPLTAEQAEAAFAYILSGKAAADEIAAFLLALKEKGETAEEILGAARAMRALMRRIDAPDNALDVCGTGGDGAHTLNISTATAIVVAACGVPVAKHGNRAVSSRSGSSDVLQALGLNLDADDATLTRCLAEARICYLPAPSFHPALRHVAPVRQALKTRTIFNLLGPLCNPAGVQRQLLGVYAPDLLQPMAHALSGLGSARAWLVHGGGLDELSIGGVSQVCDLAERSFTLSPGEAGLPVHPPAALAGGDAQANAEALQRLLKGERGAYRDAVLLNTAAALIVAEAADDLHTGAQRAADAIDSGAAQAVLQHWVTLSRDS